ncbi:MAG: hypothetical protein IJZ70_03845 [Bacteroidales bacterium]|nr:hypothetical protein [Bacteroidales bacterium]MBQ8811425.1 hypothetical protein [Bacteroidales bacterium]
MKNFTLFLFSALCVACATTRQAAPSEKTVTEIRIKTVYKTDTVYLEVPKIVENIVTADTSSVLENDYALSSASVSDGLLSHSLETKPVQQPVEVQTKIVYRDSVIFRDRIVTETLEVEKDLSRWQTFMMKTGGITLTILSLLALAAISWIIIKILRKRA